MKIALFGGAFDPVTKGHIEIARQAISIHKIDKVIFIPNNKGPFKVKTTNTKGEDRINMLNLVIEENMVVSNFEVKKSGTNYSIDVIKYYKNKYRNDELFFIIGSDNLSKISKWKDIDEINKLVKFIVFRRSENINKTNIKKYNALLTQNEIINISSSDFKNNLNNFSIVDEKVRKYIGQNFIYFNDILKNTLSSKRYIHSLRAAEFAAKLSKAHNYNIKIAYFASLLHDLTKEWEEKMHLQWIRKFSSENKEIDKYKFHEKSAAIFLKEVFFIENYEMLNAIGNHTSFCLNPTLLDKIVFLSDKLCQGRKWEGIQKVREISMKNIDEALAITLKKTYEFNLSKGIKFDKKQKEIYDKWINMD